MNLLREVGVCAIIVHHNMYTSLGLETLDHVSSLIKKWKTRKKDGKPYPSQPHKVIKHAIKQIIAHLIKYKKITLMSKWLMGILLLSANISSDAIYLFVCVTHFEDQERSSS